MTKIRFTHISVVSRKVCKFLGHTTSLIRKPGKVGVLTKMINNMNASMEVEKRKT